MSDNGIDQDLERGTRSTVSRLYEAGRLRSGDRAEVFENPRTYIASQVTNSIVSLQATAVGMSAQPFDCELGVHGTLLRAFRDPTNRSVPARLRLMVSEWVVDSTPFPDPFFQRRVRFLPVRRASQEEARPARADDGSLEDQVGVRRHSD